MHLDTPGSRRHSPGWHSPWIRYLLAVGLLVALLTPGPGNVAAADSSRKTAALEWKQTSQEPLHDDALWDDDLAPATGARGHANAATVATTTAIELVDHSVLVSSDRLQSLQLPGAADRSIRVSALDDPFDDSDDPMEDDPFAEPRIEENGTEDQEAEETDAGERNTEEDLFEGIFMEDQNENLENDKETTDSEQTGQEQDQPVQPGPREEMEPQPATEEQVEPLNEPFNDEPAIEPLNQPATVPSPVTAPADSVPSPLKPLERSGSGNRPPGQEEVRPETGREDFSPAPLQLSPNEGANEETDLEQREKNMLREELAENDKNCAEEFTRLKSARIDSIDLNIRVAGKAGEDYPYECDLGSDPFRSRSWPPTTYLWKASGLCHKPLYFEQVQLERYGHSWGPHLQPLVSGAHFFATLPILPYKMGLKTPHECVYSLGYYRPGSCAPYLLDPVPFTWRAALFEAGFVVGAAAAIP